MNQKKTYIPIGNKSEQMKEIDIMLEKWIYNSIIREQLRNLIIKEINKNEKV